jgi:hypothetical protein
MATKKIKVTESVKAEDGTVSTTEVNVEQYRDEALKSWKETGKIDLSTGESACRFLLLALDDEAPYEALLALAAADEDSISQAACSNPKADAAVQLARTKSQLSKKINENKEEKTK